MKLKRLKIQIPLWNTYFNPRQQLYLLILTVLGVVLRLWTALSTPLWRDEIYIFYTSHNNSLWNLITQQHWDTAHPPLHSILLHYWQLLSTHPFWLRLPSVIASTFTLYLIPILAIKLTKKYKAFPFVFLFLFAISITQISVNIVVRPYPFFILCMVISILLLMDMIEKNQNSKKRLIYFVAVNTLIAFLDYSAIWLFSTYFIFFLLYFFYKPQRPRYTYIFWSMFVSAICALAVVPLLLSKLDNSLHLERYIEPLKPDKMSVKGGSSLYLYIDKKNQQIAVYNSSLNKIALTRLSKNPLPENLLYMGYNLPPLSYINIQSLKSCSVGRRTIHLASAIKGCKFTNLLLPIQENMILPPHKKIVSFFTGKSIHILNTQIEQWEVNHYKHGVPIQKSENVLLEINFTSMYALYPPGINIYGKLHAGTGEWWEQISRFTISAPEGNYRAVYYDGTTPFEQHIFGEKGIIEKVSGSLLFFSSFPDVFSDTYAYLLFALFALLVSQYIYISHLFKNRSPQLLFMSLLFFIPILLSLGISYYFVPIFLGRNLHLVSLSYICGISLLISQLISERKKHKRRYMRLLAGIIIALFLSALIYRIPYLYYVDPPYDTRMIAEQINNSPSAKKYVVLNNDAIYDPLLKYALLPYTERKNISIIDLSSIESYLKTNRNYTFKELGTDIFFLQFGQSQNAQGDDFNRVAHTFKCNLKKFDIPYIYFAHCRH